MKQNINQFITKFLILQKRNKIRNLCCSNSIILYLFAKNKVNIKLDVISGYIFIVNDKGRYSIVEHCWCEYNGIILEPSYQYCDQITSIIYRKYIKKFCDIPKFVFNDIRVCEKKELLERRNILNQEKDMLCNDKVGNTYIKEVATHLDFM